jgi:hypothetical protein
MADKQKAVKEKIRNIDIVGKDEATLRRQLRETAAHFKVVSARGDKPAIRGVTIRLNKIRKRLQATPEVRGILRARETAEVRSRQKPKHI